MTSVPPTCRVEMGELAVVGAVHEGPIGELRDTGEGALSILTRVWLGVCVGTGPAVRVVFSQHARADSCGGKTGTTVPVRIAGLTG